MRNNPYFNSHLLEVIASPIDQVTQTEYGTVRIFDFFIGTTFQIAVVAGFQDVGPLGKKLKHNIYKKQFNTQNINTLTELLDGTKTMKT